MATRSGQIAATSWAGLSTCDDPAAGVGAPTTPVSPFPSFHRPATPAGRPRPRLAPDADRPRVTAVYRLLAFLRAWPPLGGWGASASAVDLDDGGGGGLDGQADSRARVGGQGAPFAVPGGVAGDRGAAERGSRPPGVSRLPAGESHDLRTSHPRAGRDDRDGGIRRARAVCLVDDCEVILARRADAIGGQVDAVRVVDLGGLDLPRRAEGERFDAVSFGLIT